MQVKKQNLLVRIVSIRGMAQVLTVTLALIIMCIIFGGINKNFFSADNVMNLLRQVCPILLVGIGQSYVLITGNIDLSIGAAVGMSCMVSATLIQNGMPVLPAIIITMLLAIVVGILNGYLVGRVGLPAFIATLGTQIICRGAGQIVNNNYNTNRLVGEGVDRLADTLYYGKTLGMFNPVWITLIIFALSFFVLEKCRTGRYLYAIGSNREAAKLSGVNVVKTTILSYIVSGTLAGLVGLFTMSIVSMGTMDAGTNYELNAVAASVIGGVSTLGGQGMLLGTFVGACIWGVMYNGLQFAGAPVALRNIVIGVIVIMSVLIDIVIRQRRAKKSKV